LKTFRRDLANAGVLLDMGFCDPHPGSPPVSSRSVFSSERSQACAWSLMLVPHVYQDKRGPPAWTLPFSKVEITAQTPNCLSWGVQSCLTGDLCLGLTQAAHSWTSCPESSTV
jgi:hypothetical protein